MQPLASDNAVIEIKKPADFLDEIVPLLSSANSQWDGLLIESYAIQRTEPTPKHCFSDRHLISIQRAGIVKAHEKQSVTVRHPGAIAICPVKAPQTSYSFLNARVAVAMLDPAFVRRALGNAINSDAFEIIPKLPTRDEQLDHLVRAAEIEIATGLTAGRLFFESLGTALAAHLLTHHANKRVTPRHYGSTMPVHLLRRVTDFIQENLGKELSLAELSADVQMSKYHFCRLFKRSTGFSPHQYVKRERVQRARQLLAEHRLSLIEIANDLGFSDQSHFTRSFHTVVGVTPAQYSAGIRA
jgi:AraC family transcriptional regulator